MTPVRTRSSGLEFDNEVAGIYARLSDVERKADLLRTEVRSRCDRIEARFATGLAELVDSDDADDVTAGETLLRGIGGHLAALDADLDALAGHLAGIDLHLVQVDARFSEALRGSALT